MKHEPPYTFTNFPELHASHPEAWAYMHVINKKTGHLFTYGLDLDTLEWDGCVDDVLEDQVNGESEEEEITDEEAIMADHLADVALETFKKLKLLLLFQDFGGQAFSAELLPNRVLHSAVLSFEYERLNTNANRERNKAMTIYAYYPETERGYIYRIDDNDTIYERVLHPHSGWDKETEIGAGIDRFDDITRELIDTGALVGTDKIYVLEHCKWPLED